MAQQPHQVARARWNSAFGLRPSAIRRFIGRMPGGTGLRSATISCRAVDGLRVGLMPERRFAWREMADGRVLWHIAHADAYQLAAWMRAIARIAAGLIERIAARARVSQAVEDRAANDERRCFKSWKFARAAKVERCARQSARRVVEADSSDRCGNGACVRRALASAARPTDAQATSRAPAAGRGAP